MHSVYTHTGVPNRGEPGVAPASSCCCTAVGRRHCRQAETPLSLLPFAASGHVKEANWGWLTRHSAFYAVYDAPAPASPGAAAQA
jgi:hypothetical protein